MRRLPRVARDALEAGIVCYLAAASPAGPHVTPVVFVLDGRRVWATISRKALKNRLFRRDPAVAGMVRSDDTAVVFRGTARVYDALAPRTWPGAWIRALPLARATARFSLKNLRFFAGYARDAYRVPLAWTPPGRVLVSVDIEAGAVLDLEQGKVAARWSGFGGRAAGRSRFTTDGGGSLPDDEAPRDVRELVGDEGPGVLGLSADGRMTVLPVRWARAAEDGAYYAVLPRAFLALAGAGAEFRAALVVDRSSRWRAAKMAGLLLRGPAEAFLADGIGSGKKHLLERAERTGDLPTDPAVVRLRPERAVWWKGWASGTVGRP